jgi:hypothetical protein
MPNSVVISGNENSSTNTRTSVKLNDGHAHHVDISVNGTFMKAFIDNQRVINDPEFNFSVEGHTDSQGNKGVNLPL